MKIPNKISTEAEIIEAMQSRASNSIQMLVYYNSDINMLISGNSFH